MFYALCTMQNWQSWHGNNAWAGSEVLPPKKLHFFLHRAHKIEIANKRMSQTNLITPQKRPAVATLNQPRRAAPATLSPAAVFNFHHYTNSNNAPKFDAIVAWTTKANTHMADVLGVAHAIAQVEPYSNIISFGDIDEDSDDDAFDAAAKAPANPVRINQLMQGMFRHTLYALDVLELAGVGDMFKANTRTPVNGPLNFVGTPKLVTDDKITNFNRRNDTLKVKHAGVNIDFFMDHIEYRTRRDGTTKNFLKLALGVPNWSLPSATAANHLAVTNDLKNMSGNSRSPVMLACDNTNMRFMRLTVWDKYCQVVAGYYRVPLVVMALQAGWQPLFLFKNLVMGYDMKKRHTLFSCDDGAKTGVYLIGFWKMRADALQVVSLNNTEGVYVTASGGD
jgi:hypothetical protein